MNLTTVDFILIFAYFGVLLLIGYFTSKKQTPDDYLIAERKLGTWSTMATVNASKSGSILMVFVALTYVWGFAAIWYFIGVIVGALLFIPFSLKLKEESKHKFYTLADYFKYNYGKKASIFASLVSIFLMFGFAMLNLIAGTKIFTFFTGWPFWLCAILMTLIILIYLLLGGFKAVAKTDILQYAAMVFILFVLALMMFKGSLIPASEWNFFATNIGTLLGFFIMGIIFPFASPDLWQRVYSSKGKKQLRNGLLLSILIYAFMAFLLALVALTVKAQFPAIDPDLALIHGFANLLPQGLVGLSTVLLFAAIMSSLDTYIYTGSSAIIQDFFEWSKSKTVKNVKKTIFFFTIIGTIVAILIQNLIVGSYIFVAFLSTTAVPVLATWNKKTIKQETLAISFIFGLMGTIIFLMFSLSKGEITPAIILVAMGSSILGLLIGGVISKIKN